MTYSAFNCTEHWYFLCSHIICRIAIHNHHPRNCVAVFARTSKRHDIVRIEFSATRRSAARIVNYSEGRMSEVQVRMRFVAFGICPTIPRSTLTSVHLPQRSSRHAVYRSFPSHSIRMLEKLTDSSTNKSKRLCIMAAPSSVNSLHLNLFKPLDMNALAAELEVPVLERESILTEFLPHSFATVPHSPQRRSPDSQVSLRRNFAQESSQTPILGSPSSVEEPRTSRARRPLSGRLLRKISNF